MRALVFAATVLLGAAPVLGVDTEHESAPPLSAVMDHMQRLPLTMPAIRPLPPQPDTYPPMRFYPYDPGDTLKTSTVKIGPLSARLGGTTKRTNLAHYRLEGMNVLGGSVSGTLDTRGARIYLRWPPNGDE